MFKLTQCTVSVNFPFPPERMGHSQHSKLVAIAAKGVRGAILGLRQADKNIKPAGGCISSSLELLVVQLLQFSLTKVHVAMFRPPARYRARDRASFRLRSGSGPRAWQKNMAGKNFMVFYILQMVQWTCLYSVGCTKCLFCEGAIQFH